MSSIEDFVETPCADLVRRTGISHAQLCRYDNGQALKETTLIRIGKILGLEPWDVLRLYHLRRQRHGVTELKKRKQMKKRLPEAS
ncbi:hypothetical protein NIES2135_27160 [Leptolyngbya boryana NIES-2135]|jgi:DNA-binding Xre family transcriptional regulator|uniref:Uncharacterized protein n=1 Tax=Leptolyngbya boryana NIES-2135 TaxID=1973484 RepID=A0A1Z4JGN7_LEPBY|nr:MULTISPECIES: helix-turn-helix domain-containing protein [Leptolyngbya]BAY55891.1 hypothetical protein NIES2135_27160 [Leptolyngbya boryana NIES-2135]MBD2368806.1 helix-turn-helix domain-containing protein [Leptolyngbya sp. FACHB-161]MBD2375326.1 helix-turn-helix domain-containing protein [Leptolyngbya sp. FACHB-238]MBD2399744.1 helix-turn-helix domain-containing protein [Leptolyngbya sp. FACHB-239]MBD2405950.1 helix-turn-helix domain-containing protein [Leptolyngbya sp. FACHB-402]